MSYRFKYEVTYKNKGNNEKTDFKMPILYDIMNRR